MHCQKSLATATCHGPIHRPHAVADLYQLETRNVAIFSTDFCLTCWYYKQRLGTHWLRAVLSFLVQSPPAKWLYGCLQGNQLRSISISNLRIKLRHHWQNLGFDHLFFLLFLLLSLSFLSFFLSLCHLVRFMAFQSILVGTTPPFTIIINSNKRSFLGQYIAILWSDLTALCNILWRFQR